MIFIAGQTYFKVEMPGIIEEVVDELEEQLTSGEKSEMFNIALVATGWYVLFSLIQGIFLFMQRQQLLLCLGILNMILKMKYSRSI